MAMSFGVARRRVAADSFMANSLAAVMALVCRNNSTHRRNVAASYRARRWAGGENVGACMSVRGVVIVRRAPAHQVVPDACCCSAAPAVINVATSAVSGAGILALVPGNACDRRLLVGIGWRAKRAKMENN